MRVPTSTRYAALAMLVGALGCAGNPEPDEAAAARDTTEVSDTLAQARDTAMTADTTGMVGDTIQTPGERSPSDTFADQQGVGMPQDTAGYGGLERPDTTGQAQTDTTAGAPGAVGGDTTQMNHGADSTRMGHDTTGYNPSQQPSQDQPSQDTTSGRY